MRWNRPCLHLIVLILTTLGSGCVMSAKTYPANIAVISRSAEYRASVAADPNKTLVDLADWIPEIRLDLRYASADNVTGRPLYTSARAYLRQPAAEALAAVQHALRVRGLGLKVFDAYRPYVVTVALWDAVQDDRYVAHPATGSRHNRGCAVDLTLVYRDTGEELLMPTGFDDFSERAHHGYAALPAAAIRHRELLKAVMEQHGFTSLPTEWWHFDCVDWKRFELLDLDFDQL